MTRWMILWCLLFHKKTGYGKPVRSAKCRKCGMYYRLGPASRRWQGWGNHRNTPLRVVK